MRPVTLTPATVWETGRFPFLGIPAARVPFFAATLNGLLKAIPRRLVWATSWRLPFPSPLVTPASLEPVRTQRLTPPSLLLPTPCKNSKPSAQALPVAILLIIARPLLPQVTGPVSLFAFDPNIYIPTSRTLSLVAGPVRALLPLTLLVSSVSEAAPSVAEKSRPRQVLLLAVGVRELRLE